MIVSSRSRKKFFAIPFAFVLAITLADDATAADPPDKTVRVFYIQPTDVADNPKYASGIASVMKSAQKYFLDQCKFTFKLNDPVCEVVKGTHPRSWYENTQNGPDKYWWAVYNGRDDLLNLVPSIKADNNRKRWKVVYYIDAEGDGAGGGGGGGWVLLPKHDADGALGYPKDTARWVGGMSHELGHCFGLPDAAATDGTVMSASFYNWPNCTITAAMTTTMKNLSANAGFWFTEVSTGILVQGRRQSIRKPSWQSTLPILNPEMLLGRRASSAPALWESW